jgi:DNA-binding beta-propeller fold protein YncE
MKRFTILMMFLMLGLCSLVFAGERIGVVANSNTNSIHFIDPKDNSVTPNYLGGELGSYGGGLFDVVITPNGKTAIVSNFGDSRIWFIDISGGFNNPPTILGFVRTGMFAEDMVVTPNGQYVLVADGGFSPYVSVILTDPTLIRRNYLGSRYAQAIDITPDGQTVLVADYSGMAVHAYTLNYADGSLIHKKTIRITPFPPVNIAIAPDGRTVIVPIAGYSACVILYFDTAGELHYKGHIAMPSKNGQSCVFSQKSKGKYPFEAYYLSNSQNKGTLVHILNVTGPGQVTPSGTSIKIWPRRGTSQLFGVDTMALDPKENWLYVTNPTLSGGIADVAVVDLDLEPPMQVGYIPTNGIPTGIAFTEIKSGDEDGE